MAIFRNTGPISFEDVAEFFGQNRNNTHSLDNYYRGGGIVPSLGPTGGQGSINQLSVLPATFSDPFVSPQEHFIYLEGRTRALTLNSAFDSSMFTGIATTSDGSHPAGPFYARSSALFEAGNRQGLGFDFQTITDTLRGQLENFFGVGRSSNFQTVDPPREIIIYASDSQGNEFLLSGEDVDQVVVTSTRILLSYDTSRNLTAEVSALFERNEIITWNFLNTVPVLDDITTVEVTITEGVTTNVTNTFRLADNLTTPQQLSDDLFAQLQATTSITDVRTLRQGVVDTDILSRIEASEVRLFYEEDDYSNAGDLPAITNRDWSFSDYTGTVATDALNSGIAFPDPLPTSARVVTNNIRIFDTRVAEAFPVYTPGTQLDLVDVSQYRRRMLVSNEDASVVMSYLISSFAASTTGLTQILDISGGRAASVRETEFLATLTGGTLSPNSAMYVVEESEIGVEIGDPVIFITDIDTGTELHNESLTLGLNSGSGDLTGSSSGLHHSHESDPLVPSEVQLDFGTGVNPEILSIELGGALQDGIATVIANAINTSNGELSASLVSSYMSLYSARGGRTDLNYRDDPNGSRVVLSTYTIHNTRTENIQDARTVTQDLPSDRPDDAYVVSYFGTFGGTATDAYVNAANLAFPGIYSGETIGLTDVTGFNRRFIINTPNFTGSYELEEVSIDEDSRLQQFHITNPRDATAFELSLVPANQGRTSQMAITGDIFNIVQVEDSVFRDIEPPRFTVIERGTGDIFSRSVTVTETREGLPTTRTTENSTIEYSTGDVALNAEGWNFHDGITGDRVQLTTWPTTGDVVLHIGGLEFSFAELETTLDIDNINGTLRTPTFSTLTFSYNFLGLATATSTYDISGIRTFNTGTGVALVVVLDGTTGVHSLAASDPAFANGDVVGLTFTRSPRGEINTDIPDHPGVGNPFPPISFDNFYNANNGEDT